MKLIFIVVTVAMLTLSNCAPLTEKDPENLEELEEMYTCHRVPKKSCRTTDRIKCHRKRILHHVYKLCAKLPVEECHIKHETVCIRKSTPNNLDHMFRQYSG